ncbi:MAG TPA: peptidyl-prolyl cis-trans isomerase, partial [Polyangiaceae bacterium]|nr:peptidyl-prolyl cis-trans isomerase [Polyangiaceae bacterium]
GFAIPDLGGVFPQVVEADGRVYIVRLVSRNAAGLRSYAEAERTIRVTLAQQRIREAEVRLERELRARFEVRIDEAALAGVSVASSAVPTASATPGVAPSTREASGGDRAAAP